MKKWNNKYWKENNLNLDNMSRNILSITTIDNYIKFEHSAKQNNYTWNLRIKGCLCCYR